MSQDQSSLRSLPAVDTLVRHADAASLEQEFGREAVVSAARRLLEEERERLRRDPKNPASADSLVQTLELTLRQELAPGLRPVVNATGVVIHTNLGRAPLAPEALDQVAEIGGRYLNLEFDLESGKRGGRASKLEAHIREVTGAEAALAVNNNAAAVLLLLRSLARGKEVVVSRGELVEIGGSFRIPDVMEASGARLREVGTTNRTHLRDYESACGPDTAILLKVHPSNFQVVGFTHEVGVAELAGLGRTKSVPVAIDLGSGLIEEWPGLSLEGETTVRAALEAGAALVTFSGDKALGGPQAGYLVGSRDLVDRCRKNPLMRALRLDRMTLAAAEATWNLYRRGRGDTLPAVRMLCTSPRELRVRATHWLESLSEKLPGFELETREQEGRVGGGTAPGSSLTTTVLALRSVDREAGALASALRSCDPPVVGRVQDGWLLLDPRTVLPDEEDALIHALASLASPPGP